MNNNGTALLPVNGEPRHKESFRIALGLVCIGFATWSWLALGIPRDLLSIGSQDQLGSAFIVLVLVALGLVLPHTTYVYLDLRSKQLVTETHYGGWNIRRQCRTFDKFGAIVVRHLCHAGEGEESYSGGVGLRPADGGRVIWLKNFTATPDAVPPQAHDYARQLHERTGIPVAPLSI